MDTAIVLKKEPVPITFDPVPEIIRDADVKVEETVAENPSSISFRKSVLVIKEEIQSSPFTAEIVPYIKTSEEDGYEHVSEEIQKDRSGKKTSLLNENQTSELSKSVEIAATQVQRTRTGHCCDVCGKVYSRKGTLVRHMMSHTGEKPYSCNACHKTFTRPSHLRSHSVIHTGERPFSCTICGNNFAQRNSLKRHMRAHSGDRPYLCSCGKTFAKRDVLQTHMLVHIQTQPHKCETCGRTFAYRGNLKNHQLLHTGVKPHSCPVCRKAFTQLSHVKTHVLAHRHFGHLISTSRLS